MKNFYHLKILPIVPSLSYSARQDSLQNCSYVHRLGNIIRTLLFFKILLVLVFLTLLVPIFAQVGTATQSSSTNSSQFFFELFDRRDGLASLSVSSIVQDQRGFLWVGTQGGLHRYNGNTMTLYEHQPFNSQSLSSNVIQSLYYDESHQLLWIGTYQGLNVLDLRSNTMENFSGVSEGLKNQIVTAMGRDSRGTLWVGTLGGLHRLVEPDSTTTEVSFHHYPVGNSDGAMSNPVVRGIHTDRIGRLWIVTNGGLYLYRPDTDDFIQEVGTRRGNFPSDLGMVIREDSRGLLYIGFWEAGVAVYDPDTRQVLETLEFEDQRIYSMILDRDEQLWVGTWGGGLFYLDRTTNQIIHSVNQRGVRGSLAGNIIYALFEDRTGMVWVGIHGGGLHKFHPFSRVINQKIHDPNNPQSLSTGSVSRIFRDSQNRYWVGTYNGGLNLMDQIGGPVQRFTAPVAGTSTVRSANQHGESTLIGMPYISNNIIRDIIQDPTGSIWVATNQYLNRYNEDGSFTHFRTQQLDGDLGLPDQTIMAILPAQEPGLFWLGTYSMGVVLWGPERGVIDTLDVPESLIYGLLKDPSNRLWIASNRGVHLYDEVRIQSHYRDGTRQGLAGQTARVIALDTEGFLWVGTVEGGVTVLSPDFQVVAHFSKENGMVSNTVSGLLAAPDGTVWVTTNRGVNQVSLTQGVLRSLTQQQGLSYDEFASGSMVDLDGTLYLGNVDAISRFHPRDLPEFESSFPPVITQVNIGNLENHYIPPAGGLGTIMVPWSYNNVLIEFATLDFSGSRQARFFYQLEGFDSQWQDGADRRFASYTNLPPGTYRFRVSLGIPDTFQGFPSDSTLVIRVQAPPHLRWWAFVLYGLTFMLVLYLVTQVRVSQALTNQVAALEKAQIALEEANSKLNFMSYHDTLSGLGNRRLFEDTLQKEWVRCRRSSQPFSLIIVDIDFFKRYNDTLGHPAGDKVIQIVAEVLQQGTSRRTDQVCRIGGEEFAVILPDTPSSGALQVAKMIQQLLNDQAIPHPESDVAKWVTVSMGIASIYPKDQNPKDFLYQADQALYRAKHQGRNTIILESWDSLESST
jgi:diguanylate cyclase (GGDEF)-like protein